MFTDLWARAQNDLCPSTAGGLPDLTIWEHSTRVARLTEIIAGFPEVSRHVLDRAALTLAALYHDIGWLLQLRAGQIRSSDLLLKRTTGRQREMASEWMIDHLEGLLAPRGLQLAARIVRECSDRQARLPEVQILTEAESLDEIGPQAIWGMVRRQLTEGKSLLDLVEVWRRQQEYRYWPTWIRDCLQFPSSRVLAEERYQSLARFMADLQTACLPPIAPQDKPGPIMAGTR
ncbi:MAG TPA: HD domain-containing protein [Phycisphaerae bacterium]|nr:HD domain-containing protein [Phycisphaerae bacterium]HRY67271.1 HD domain-containing protein [Phycisphaerae bacterium]HSA26359.1 HD domain-containing protein [Phycisphaerae bacterium]